MNLHLTRRTTRGVAVLALAVPALAGCSFTGTASARPVASTSQGRPTPATTTPTTTPATTAPSTSGTTSSPSRTTRPSSSSSASSTSSSVPRCSLDRLTVALGQSEGAAGSIYVPITFTNKGPVCRLQGHPGVDGLGSDGGTVHADRTGTSSTGSSATPVVVLTPNGHASALLRASDVPRGSGPCPSPFTALLVTPPDLTRSARVAADLPACGGLVVGPVVPGTQG